VSPPTLNEELAKQEPRSAPEPETAEERFERLLPKRRWPAVIGATATAIWLAFEVLGHVGQFGKWGFIALVGATVVAIVIGESTEDDDDD